MQGRDSDGKGKGKGSVCQMWQEVRIMKTDTKSMNGKRVNQDDTNQIKSYEQKKKKMLKEHKWKLETRIIDGKTYKKVKVHDSKNCYADCIMNQVNKRICG